MTLPNYATGQLIRRSHYNQLVTGTTDVSYNHNLYNLGTVWGTGFGRRGYGQTIGPIAPIPAIDPATGQPPIARSAEWDNIDIVLQASINHQQGAGTYTPLPGNTIQAGQLISPILSFEPNIQTAYNQIGQVYVTTEGAPLVLENTNRIWGIRSDDDPSNAPGLQGKLVFVHTLDFPTADALRYFFNAGGKVKVSMDHIPDALTPKNDLWNNLCRDAGTIEIGYQNTRKLAGTGNSSTNRYTALDANNGGIWAQSTNVRKTHFTQHVIYQGYGYKQGYRGYDSDYTWGYNIYGEWGQNINGSHPYGYLTEDPVLLDNRTGTYRYNYDYRYDSYHGQYPGQDTITVDLLVTNSDSQNGNIGRTLTITTTMQNGPRYLIAPVDNRPSGTTRVAVVIAQPAGGYLANSWGPIQTSFSGPSTI